MAKYDMTIIGGGSGGLIAARTAAALGASVLLIDKEKLGGDCLHYGCVPSKSMIHVAKVVRQTREAAKVGLMSADLRVDMGKVSEYIQGVIERVGEGEHRYTEGVTVKFGQIAFKSATELSLNGELISSRNSLIATGSRPLVPGVEGLEETGGVTAGVEQEHRRGRLDVRGLQHQQLVLPLDPLPGLGDEVDGVDCAIADSGRNVDGSDLHNSCLHQTEVNVVPSVQW